MNSLELYEKKFLDDEEFPIQLELNKIRGRCCYFGAHWHEHLELHYVIEGRTTLRLNQRDIKAEKGDLIVINSNELHTGFCDTLKMDAAVVIFEMDAFSKELANHHYLFQSRIRGDEKIQEMILAIYKEREEKATGYKLAVKGMVLQLITYLVRNYVEESLSDSESNKRKKNLNRLNTVLQYMQQNYADEISNVELAKLIHISEGRFNHLFKESIGTSPLTYLNELRITKAKKLLEQGEHTVSEIALAVGFQDFNHFGRLFRKQFGCTPSSILKKK